MKKHLCLAMLVFSLASCGKADNDPMDFVGVWENKESPAPTQNRNGSGITDFSIQDRILIKSDDGKVFQVAILARGVFAQMKYDADHGYICAENNACFALKDKNTLLVGNETGQIVSYRKDSEK